MKTKYILLTLCTLGAMQMSAQTVYDGAALSQKDLNGTARFVGMGGAMGALGGDLTTMGVNPAGIGIYRSNDASLTMGYSITGAESNYGGFKQENNKYRFSFDNAGVVISTKIGNQTALRYMNFGFNYRKAKSFYKNMSMAGILGAVQMDDGSWQSMSQARMMAQQASNGQAWLFGATGEQFNYGSNDIYTDADAGWLGAMGYQGALIEENAVDPIGYRPIVPSDVSSSFLSRERGGIDQYDFNMAFNINDRFYFGVTIGAYDVDYNKYSFYDEWYDNNLDEVYDGGEDYYSLETWKRIKGTGVDFKFGAIFRPFEYSPLRIGLAVHTPTFYKLTYTTGAFMRSEYSTDEGLAASPVDTYEALGGRDMDLDFELRTPWLINASLGYTVGSQLALGAEYEYEDYSSMKFRDVDGYDLDFQNDEAKLNLKAVHTLRLGAEYKPVPEVAFRLGYNYSTDLFDGNALKYLPDNAIDTDTDFDNRLATNTFTLGVGYRFGSVYFDMAYKYDTYKSNFYAFYNEFSTGADASQFDHIVSLNDYQSGNYFVATPEATKVTHSRHQLLFTLGYRF